MQAHNGIDLKHLSKGMMFQFASYGSVASQRFTLEIGVGLTKEKI